MILNYVRATHGWYFCCNSMIIILIFQATKGLCYDNYSIFRRIIKSFHFKCFTLQVWQQIVLVIFWKSYIILLFFIQSQQILDCKWAYLTALQISRKLTKLLNFSKVCKKIKKKNTKNIRWTLKAYISTMAGQTCGIGGSPLWGIIHSEMVCFHSGIAELWMCENSIFLVTV